MIFGDFRTIGLEHSYQVEPPGYSQPQKLYHYYYRGFMLDRSKNFVWKVGPPFFIIEGQGTSGITIELIPTLSKYREKEIDFRVSVFPTINGEKVAIRILDKSSGLLDINKDNPKMSAGLYVTIIKIGL